MAGAKKKGGKRKTEMKTMGAEEFVRRLKVHIQDEDCRFAFFLGSGCSVSSGIPAAGELVKGWLPRLKEIIVISSSFERYREPFLPLL